MVETFSKDLVEDFKKLYETKEHYDTIIIVGEEPNVERIYAHFIILCTRSTYFRSALSDKWAERKEGYLVLQKPNISALTFKLILKFLYCGIVDLTNQEYEAILNLLVAADELLIQRLTDFVQDFLIKNNSAFLQQCPIKMLHYIVNNDQFNELKNAYLDIFCKTPHLLFDSDKYPSLEKDALKLILKCDNLDMKESDIWKKLVEWGIAQHTMHEGDMMCQDTKYDDLDILRETLQELIKLIRFYQMDREAFIPDVWEYVNILPNDLVKDVLRDCTIIDEMDRQKT
ncbi:26422_t:CDS:2 [Racocetra persica]|uniref:26422_t:CDS:1 n=1 Tax=Racocetra persica TaxID=160502 RepID=A0ACA9LGT2_9GLOM|nr:26422_t:CDS:2 [Racocetra persica]